MSKVITNTTITGWNTTLTIKTHSDSIPSQPALGKALSSLEIEIPIPRLASPENPGEGDGHDGSDDGKPHFIEDATVVSTLSRILSIF